MSLNGCTSYVHPSVSMVFHARLGEKCHQVRFSGWRIDSNNKTQNLARGAIANLNADVRLTPILGLAQNLKVVKPYILRI